MLWNLGRVVLLCLLCSRYIHCMENDGEGVDQTSGDGPGSSADGGQSSADNGQSSVDNGQTSINDQQSMDYQESSTGGPQPIIDDRQPLIDDQQICDIIIKFVIEEMQRFSCSIEREILGEVHDILYQDIEMKTCGTTLERTVIISDLNIQIGVKANPNYHRYEQERRTWLSSEDCFTSPSTQTMSTLPTTPTTKPWPRTRSTITTPSSTSTSTSSSTSDTGITRGIDPNSDKSTSCASDSTNNSVVVSTIIAGFVSFIAGILSTLLLMWLLCSKRRPGLCYQQQPEKTPERMTSDKVTKKILAKHLMSDRKEPTAPENKGYFVNESGVKHVPVDTEGTYNDIDQEGQPQGVYTTIQTSGTTSGTTPSSPPSEEHIYRDLDLDRSADTENNENKVKINDVNGNKETQKKDGTVAVRYKEETDMFDHARESTVSGHDYFVLQNDNFRPNSEQTGRTPSGMDPGYADEIGGNVDNDYFVLEKQH